MKIDMKSSGADSGCLGALHAVAKPLSVNFGQRRMLQQVLASIEKDFALRRCTVMLLSSRDERLVFEAASDPRSVAGPTTSYRKGEGITGRVLETGEAVIVPSISGEPAFRDRIHRRGLGSDESVGFVCVPISVGNEVVGTLAADVPANSKTCLKDAKELLSIVSCMIAHDVQLRRTARVRQEALEEENLRLRSELQSFDRPANLRGNSRSMQDVYRRIHQVAPTDTTVLIRGESGTGKELVASAIHYGSKRAEGPFIKVNCAALTQSLLESELFGHEKGAFTGAHHSRAGRVEAACGGTLFLDEIGDIPLSLQVKLLRVLQEREFERVGSNTTTKADIRIIAATNCDLEAAIVSKRFRKDLYYRINVFPIYVPPLRDRKADIMTLADHFVAKFSKKLDKEIHRITTSAINMMYAYHWPGNVRELENCIEHAVLVGTDSVIHAYDLPPTLQTPDETNIPVGTFKARVSLLERDMIIDALKRHNGNVRLATKELDITERMIRYKMKNLGIDYRNLFRPGGNNISPISDGR